jgi:ubiquinone/menaquinone biosynthesis C-methylase UbiE
MDVIEREKEFWDEHAEFDWMAEGSKRDVVAMLPKLTGDVLELCIGSGMLTEHMPRTYRTYTGLDLSDTLLETLRRKMPELTLVQGNAEELCFADGSFDTVLIFAGLHHLPHFERTIAHAHRVLRPGGTFVCLEPSSRAWYRKPMEWLRDWIGIYSEDEVFLDPRRVSSALRESGFGSVRARYLTPKFSPAFLTPKNKILAHMLYTAAGMGRGGFTQSFFLLSATKA